jgi:hypothetical protein
MVYRSFGKSVPQAEIWPRISKQNRLGSLASATYLMTQDALTRGFAAMAIQVRYPLQTLRLCTDQGIRAVLNHRLKEDVQTGHYSVLVSVSPASAVLHDPYFGPSRQISNEAMLELWLPKQPNGEITGNILIGIADKPAKVPPCKLCGTAVPESVVCRACAKQIPLQPAALLGCVREGCTARMWNYLCCPSCDYTWSFEAFEEPLSAGTEQAVPDLNPAFAELDKFIALLEGFGAVASNPDVRQQIDFLRSSKDRLKLAQTEEVGYRKMRQTQLNELGQRCTTNRQALDERKGEAGKPAAQEDGNDLGRTLLKNLGLLS